jgi:predicted ferric reductase
MSNIKKRDDDAFDELATPASLLWAFGGVAVGTTLALVVLPYIAPALAFSVTNPEPKTWWYLSRASGLTAYLLLVVSMLFGLLLSTRRVLPRSPEGIFPNAATAFALHEHASILAVAFGAFHGLVLLGDRHTTFSVAQILLPFGAAYRPIAVGLGQLSFYGIALLVASFYVKKHIGQRAFRLLHFTTFIVFSLTLVHAFAMGSDRLPLMLGLIPATAVLFATIQRILIRVAGEAPAPVARS